MVKVTDTQWGQAESVVREDEMERADVVLAGSTVTAESWLTCFLQTVYRAS